MNEFFKDLTEDQKVFIVAFAHFNITQTPVVMLSNVHGLAVPHLISRLKTLRHKYVDKKNLSIIDSLIERDALLKVKNKLVTKLSKIGSVEIAGANVRFVSIAWVKKLKIISLT